MRMRMMLGGVAAEGAVDADANDSISITNNRNKSLGRAGNVIWVRRDFSYVFGRE